MAISCHNFDVIPIITVLSDLTPIHRHVYSSLRYRIYDEDVVSDTSGSSHMSTSQQNGSAETQALLPNGPMPPTVCAATQNETIDHKMLGQILETVSPSR